MPSARRKQEVMRSNLTCGVPRSQRSMKSSCSVDDKMKSSGRGHVRTSSCRGHRMTSSKVVPRYQKQRVPLRVGGDSTADSSPGADQSSFTKCRYIAAKPSGSVRTLGKTTEGKLSAGRADNKSTVVSPGMKRRPGGRRQESLALITSNLKGPALGGGPTQTNTEVTPPSQRVGECRGSHLGQRVEKNRCESINLPPPAGGRGGRTHRQNAGVSPISHQGGLYPVPVANDGTRGGPNSGLTNRSRGASGYEQGQRSTHPKSRGQGTLPGHMYGSVGDMMDVLIRGLPC